MGKLFAYRAADGKHPWTRSVGKHQNNTARLAPGRSIQEGQGRLHRRRPGERERALAAQAAVL
jgi:hypothetical protein